MYRITFIQNTVQGRYYCQRCCSTVSLYCTCGIALFLYDGSFQNIPKALLQTPSSVTVSACLLFIESHQKLEGAWITTGYGPDCPGIDSRRGRDFPHPCKPTLRPTQPPLQWVRRLFPGVKRPACGVDHPHYLETRVKKEYSYTSSPRLCLRGRL